MSAAECAIVAAVMFAFAIGIFVGHAAGYGRAKDVERRRQEAAITGGPRYARASSDVGAAE